MTEFDLYQRAAALFHEARTKPESERRHFLREACGDDLQLLSEVESLLAYDSDDDDIREGGGANLLASDIALDHGPREIPANSRIPTEIGGYRIIRLIGHGGMGAVYEAEQANPLRRVALKVVRPGLLGGQFTTRLRREAQVLGRLQHLGIAQIFEAGIADRDGTPQPYFAMEYVAGLPLDHYADGRGLCVRSRLELIARVCDAVHYAHERGIIHRDLKPSNILVTIDRDDPNEDGVLTPVQCRESADCLSHWRCAGQPKILDFGVARITDADVQMTTMRTDVGQLVGTLSYMSPEQASGDSDRLDRRSDIYTLGVLLHELLTGSPPVNIRGRSIPEAVRLISDGDPMRLGTVNSHYRGDIETIVDKALEKDPDRRYPSAEELSADLRRYLNDQPIKARPVSAIYQIRKFTRRNRALVGGMAATLIAIVAGGIVAGYYAVHEHRERLYAEQQRRLADERYDEVVRLSDLKRLNDAIAKADTLWPELPKTIPAMEKWLADYAEPLASNLELHRKTLEKLRSIAKIASEAAPNDPRWELPDKELQWRHDMLADLVQRLDFFLNSNDGARAQVNLRLDNARKIGFHTLESPAAVSTWKQAIAEVERNPNYVGLALKPQAGLLPIGVDPRSGLLECLFLRSGQAPRYRPGTTNYDMTPKSGMIMVLLPGVTFQMGAQRSDPNKTNYDPNARDNEFPVHAVTLAPFFISKFEITQGQLARMTGFRTSGYSAWTDLDPPVDDRHPAEQITWQDAMEQLPHFGLALPTEAQWEYAARAGTNTPWWSGQDMSSLKGCENIADRRLGKVSPKSFRYEDWLDDGYPVHAPVGTFAPNPFGLHDMLGNVSEWCLDTLSPYTNSVSPAIGLRDEEGNNRAMVRGGSWQERGVNCRVSARRHFPHDVRQTDIGIRPVRCIQE
ncbi:MAG: SUMF1/EgtB/PvdO family nonheme iron enzyme [Phycisphaerales bacterium]|nr:SUMF1/EgtB/PvdO family nonheme iron enzyme [Phycisphaerales bacterium]MCB9857170.1 SUMF1/EgtB/PvdO family nonheme iron enzyme [Phycisphaerales bacterium]